MKEKIIAALKTAYAKLGLSNEAFDGVASLLEKTVTEEADIATAVGGDEVKALLKTIQGQVDSWKNKFHDKDKELNAYKESHPDTDSKKDDHNDAPQEEPEWAKKLREQNEALAARFQAQEDAKILAATRSSVETKLKAAGCTNPGILNTTLKGFALGKEETEDAAVERLKGEYNETARSIFGDGPVPGVGFQSFPDSKSAVEHKNEFLKSQGLLPKEK